MPDDPNLPDIRPDDEPLTGADWLRRAAGENSQSPAAPSGSDPARRQGKQVGGAAGKQAGKQLGTAAGASVGGAPGAAVGKVVGGAAGKVAGRVAGGKLTKQLGGTAGQGSAGGLVPRTPGAGRPARSRAPIGSGGGVGFDGGVPDGIGGGKRPGGGMQGQVKQIAKQQAKKRIFQILIPLALKLFFWMTVVGAAVAIIFVLLSPFLWVFHVWHWGSGLKKEITALVQTKSGDKTVQDLLTQELDCRNASPADQKSGFCIRQDFTEASPIPPTAEWLVPVWQAAGTKYQVPWQLLAAVAGARTNFGEENCIGPGTDKSTVGGEGYYRMPSDTWLSFRDDSGHAANSSATADSSIVKNATCFTSADPTPKKWNKKDGAANPYDAVDATFALAKELHQGSTNIKSASGADSTIGPDWSDYSGVDSGACTPLLSNDGPVYRWTPDAGFVGGGGGGWNEKIQLPQDIIALGWRYTPVRTDKLTDQQFFAPYSDKNPVFGEGSPMLLPQADAQMIIVAVGHALGLPDSVIYQAEPGLMARMTQESSFHPGSVNRSDSNAAKGYTWESRGVFQFIPPTFVTWHVPGYDDIFNPVDNILAAMNAMMHSTGDIQVGDIAIPGYGYWPNGSVNGWGPNGGINPYAGTQGKSSAPGATGAADGGAGGSSSDLASVKKSPTDYKGSEPNDPISQALVADFTTPGHKPSACFIAIVHDWFTSITEHPPQTVAGANGSLAKMINVARSQLGAREVAYTDANGNNWPGPDLNHGPIVDQYLASVGIPPDFGNDDPVHKRPWCASFVSWSAQQAGVPIGPDGKGSAGVAVLTSWGIAQHIFTTGTSGGSPAPGDLVAFGSNEHIGIVVAVYPDHFVTIEGNASNTVEYVPRYPSRDDIMGYIRLTKLFGNAGGGFAPPDHLKGNVNPSRT